MKSRRFYDKTAVLVKATRKLLDRGYDPVGTFDTFVNDLANVLHEQNGNFRKDMFLAAATVPAIPEETENAEANA